MRFRRSTLSGTLIVYIHMYMYICMHMHVYLYVCLHAIVTLFCSSSSSVCAFCLSIHSVDNLQQVMHLKIYYCVENNVVCQITVFIPSIQN